MKKHIFIFLLLLSCAKEEVSKEGCLTGIRKGENYRVTIRCCTKKEFLDGSHATSNWTDYTGHQWEQCSDCN